MFMKVYATTKVMQVLCGGVDNETMMKYIMEFVHAIAYLESDVVRSGRLFPVMPASCLATKPTYSCCSLSSGRSSGKIGIEVMLEQTV